MTSFIVVIHLIIVVSLIALVLVQDAKGNGAFGVGGSNSVLGATGAQTLASKLTVYASIAFAITCIYLAWDASKVHKSVVDKGPLPAAAGAVVTPAASPAPTSGSTQEAAASAAAAATPAQ
jgi:preprotein translocase subunit SecG